MRQARPVVRRRFLPLALSAALLPASAARAQEGGLASFLDVVEVEVFNVDVVVLGPDGEPLTGLEAADFVVLQDGQPVELTNFAAYRDEGFDAEAFGQAAAAGQAPARVAEPLLAPPPATWVVYVDQARLEPGPRNQVVSETRDFLAKALRPGDRALVATFDGAALKLLSPLSAEHEGALGALEQLRKQVGNPGALAGVASQVRAELLAVDPDSMTAQQQVDQILAMIEAAGKEEALRARASLFAVRDLLSIVAGLEGRVGLLLAGGGYEADPVAHLNRLVEAQFPQFVNPQNLLARELEADVADIRTQVGALQKSVNSARVTIYSIYAGASRGPAVSAEFGGIPTNSGPSIAPPNSMEAGATLSALAEATGGRSFVGAPDLAERLEVARTDFASYYSLGYRPPREPEPGAFHEVEVRVRREGAKVVHRRGLTVRSREDAASDAAVAALLADPHPTGPRGAALEVGAAEAARGRAQRVPLSLKIPLATVTLLPDGAVHRARLLIHYAVADPDGGFRRLEPRPLAFEVPNASLAGALGQHVSFKVELALEPGAYEVAAAVYDELGGERWAIVAPVSVVKAR